MQSYTHRASHEPCSFQLDDEAENERYHSRLRSQALYHRPAPFQPRSCGQDPLAVFMPKQLEQMLRAPLPTEQAPADETMVEIEDAPFLLDEDADMVDVEEVRAQLAREKHGRRLDATSYQAKIAKLEATIDRQGKEIAVLEDELARGARAHEETKKKLEVMRESLHQVRRSVCQMRQVGSNSLTTISSDI